MNKRKLLGCVVLAVLPVWGCHQRRGNSPGGETTASPEGAAINQANHVASGSGVKTFVSHSKTYVCATAEELPTFGFDVLLFEDMDHRASDSEGRVAVGRHARFEDYALGAKLLPDRSRIDLLVGGNLIFHRGAVVSGATVHGGTADTEAALFFGGLTHGQDAFDFNSAWQWAAKVSHSLARLPNNGTVERIPGDDRHELKLTGTSPSLNVFGLNAADLAQTHTLTLAAPAGSTAILNVSGEGVTMAAFGFRYQGVAADHVVFNLKQAESLMMEKIGIAGSLLAPRAAVQFNTGVLNGFFVARSLAGNGQLNRQPFAGCLPRPKVIGLPRLNEPKPLPKPEPQPEQPKGPGQTPGQNHPGQSEGPGQSR